MALTLLAANNAQTTIAAAINATATTVSLAAGTGTLFPAPVSGTSYFKLTLIDAATEQLTEIVHVTARSGDSLTILRGQEGTTARAWSANDIAANMMTAGSLSLMAQYDTVEFLDATTGRLLNVQTFNASGTYTPTPGTKKIIVEVIGAGGGGGSASGANASSVGIGAGGGAGGYAKSLITSVPSSQSVVVGVGGNPSSPGGLSSFGSIVANGGLGGDSSISSAWTTAFGVNLFRGANGGSATGGNIVNSSGGCGGTAIWSKENNCVSGEGGASYLSGGATPIGGSSGPGNAGTAGGGGSGANANLTTTVYTGGKGGDGLVIIWEYA